MNFIQHLKNQKGAAVVEFAIVLPLLIIFTFGIIEFGVILFDKALITNASREGARFGILFNDPLHTVEEIQDRVKIHLDYGNRLINLGGPPSEIGILPVLNGSLLSVTVNYSYDFLLLPNFVPALLPGTMNLSSVTTMRME
ncbi:MAG: pilus assembly protein [Desulfobacula sp.]|jgi:hypothetical protein|nr:pilus assembly protein [Desulfobacula sp.]